VVAGAARYAVFSNTGVKISSPVLATGEGIAVNNKSKKETFMKRLELQAELGFGVKPIFTYFATGATHAPHQAPKEWIAKYKGKFDQGWDKLREETLARQIKLGVEPPGMKLAPKPKDIKDWDTLTADEKKLYSHQLQTRRLHPKEAAWGRRRSCRSELNQTKE
jgi:hypothetical protein